MYKQKEGFNESSFSFHCAQVSDLKIVMSVPTQMVLKSMLKQT